MQSVLQPVLAQRISLIVNDGHGDHGRKLIELPPKPLSQDIFKNDLILQVVKRLIKWRGVRNPKAYREAFRAIDDANNGHTAHL